MVCDHAVDPQREYGKQKLKSTMNTGLNNDSTPEALVSTAYIRTKAPKITTVLNDRQYDTGARQPMFKLKQTKRTLVQDRQASKLTTVLNNRQYDTEASQPMFKLKQTKRTRVQDRQVGKMNAQLLSSLSKAAAYMHCSASEPKNEKRTRSSKARTKVYRVGMKTDSIYTSISTSNKNFLCNTYGNYIIMVISTHAVFAVITSSTFSKSFYIYMVARLLKIRRGAAKRLKEPKRIPKIYNTSKTSHSTCMTRKDNYVVNYYNVEISTRDVFAVIKAIKYMNFIRPLKPIRHSKFVRSITRKSGKPRQTPKTCMNTKLYKVQSLTSEGNYTTNYTNVEISTRADSAVIKYLLKNRPNQARAIQENAMLHIRVMHNRITKKRIKCSSNGYKHVYGIRTLENIYSTNLGKYTCMTMVFRHSTKGTHSDVRGGMHIMTGIFRVRNENMYMPIVRSYTPYDLWAVIKGLTEILTMNKVSKQVGAYYKRNKAGVRYGQVMTKLMLYLYRQISGPNYDNFSRGTLNFKAIKSVRRKILRTFLKAKRRGLELIREPSYTMERTMMDTLIIGSFANKLSSNKHTKITIISKKLVKNEKSEVSQHVQARNC